ncbi:hypothetical protein QBC45DRAFT_175089 [Copromyces sp. CBS 386.78]|nr:hypothetical protein QBC45DRAFT_175089 [Copromyces sp. CBS 386.78]
MIPWTGGQGDRQTDDKLDRQKQSARSLSNARAQVCQVADTENDAVNRRNPMAMVLHKEWHRCWSVNDKKCLGWDALRSM